MSGIVDPFASGPVSDEQVREVLARPAVSARDVAVQAEAIRLTALRNTSSRDEAIDRGRRLGKNESDRRDETGLEREQRVARAKAYAAWEYDGKPHGGGHMREMGVAVTSENLKVLAGPDWKKKK